VLNMPRLAAGRGGPRPVNIEEPSYAEVGFVDPDGKGHARHTLEGGLSMALSEHVWRVTGGAADAPDAHSYFVGEGEAWALIDPPLGDAAHLAAVAAAAPGAVRWIFWTQANAGPGADALRAAWPDAEHSRAQPGDELQLGRFAVRVVQGGSGAGGRAFLLLPEGLLFAGESTWDAHELPAEAEWVAPLRGFLRRAR